MSDKAPVVARAPVFVHRVPAWLWVLASYVAVFVILAARFLPQLATALPLRPNLDDSYVITWVLAWVSHSLATNPSAVFDANISYPTLGQLTSTHHLFANQVGFAPVYALTGNPILGTNLVAFVSYPLAALAMERLLRTLGLPALVAWVSGFIFALGALRVPFNLNLIQYPALYLPWVALCLTKLRDQPDVRHALVLLVAFGLGVLTCFYEAVLLGMSTAIWAVFELVRKSPADRKRFLAYAIGVAAIAGLGVLCAALPYFSRLEQASAPSPFRPPYAGGGIFANTLLILGLMAQSVGLASRPLRYAGILLLTVPIAIADRIRGSIVARRVLPVALALWLTGALLSYGYPEWLQPIAEISPLKLVRYTHRFVVIGDFGLVLLVALALHAIGRWLGARAGAVACAAIALLVLVDRGIPFSATIMHRVPSLSDNAAVYDQVNEILASEGGGALLELPLVGTLPGFEQPRPYTLEPDAMLASTRHWWPTPSAHTSYHAPHRWFFMNTVAALPAWWALDDLIDLTRVRWLLIRPESFWKPRETRASTEQFLLASPAVGQHWMLDGGWLLLRLDRPPQHPAWFETVKSADVQGRTVLGTPLAPIPEEDAVATVRAADDRPPQLAGTRLALRLLVQNRGGSVWPASPPPAGPLTLDGRWGGLWSSGLSDEKSVALHWRWRKLDDGSDEAVIGESRQRLRRDLDPGEEIRELIGVEIPKEDGLYELEIGVAQIGGATFASAGNVPYRLRARVRGGKAEIEPVAPSATTPSA